MSRNLSTFHIPQNVRYKLLIKGISNVQDLESYRPSELAKDTGITVEEALEVLEAVSPVDGPLATDAFDILKSECSKFPITTLSVKLDEILGGGIPMKKITEVCGAPGSGKTQLCMQLCVNAQLPKILGGYGGKALFIDTEGSFRIHRFIQIAKGTLKHFTSSKKSVEGLNIDMMLNNLYYDFLKSHLEVIARINLLPSFLAKHPELALIVVDSIAFQFRYGFEDSYSKRTKLLNGIIQKLVKLANENDIAVVLTNQMTVRPGKGEVPALGESWGHACATRLLLGTSRQAFLLKSPSRQEATAPYAITRDGFRDKENSAS